MRVLLTGGSGMVGRNLLESPAMKKHEIVAPSRRELDLLSYERVAEFVKRTRPDAVVHAAGKVGGIQANVADPVGFYLENLDIGRNVVWAAYRGGVKRLLNLSSSCVYPRAAPNPIREESVLTGSLEPTNEGYALAKLATMKLCELVGKKDPAYRYKSLVPCNLYGKYDHFEPEKSHLVAAILDKLHRATTSGAREVTIWGDGTARREFMFAADAAECIARGLDHYDALPDVMNVGTGKDLTVDAYYQAAAEVVGFRGSFVHDTSKPAGMPRKVVDVTRLRAWGWGPSTPLGQGLRATYDHYLSMTSAAAKVPQ